MARGMGSEVVDLIPFRQGHFLLESGHHGERWLDLELLFLRPEPVSLLAGSLASRLAALEVEVVCGPLIEGAFVGLFVASSLGALFTYSERAGTSSPYRYVVPQALRPVVRGKRVAIVNDVINAGSAVGGTFADLVSCGADVVAVGALLVLGGWSERFAAENGLALEALTTEPNRYWAAEECPLCAEGVPLVKAFA